MTDWWLALTAEGGEGMVVKPLAGTAPARPGRRRRPCSRAEVPGPGVPAPHLRARLHRAGATASGCAGAALGRKWGLALREYGLGVAALDRFAAGEPLWRGHELVFAILACESEPVDPRL